MGPPDRHCAHGRRSRAHDLRAHGTRGRQIARLWPELRLRGGHRKPELVRSRAGRGPAHVADGHGGRALYGCVRLLADDARVSVERWIEWIPVVEGLSPVPRGRDGDRRHHGVCLPSGVLDSAARRGRRCPPRSLLCIRRRSQ